jgi:hypothetical protein
MGYKNFVSTLVLKPVGLDRTKKKIPERCINTGLECVYDNNKKPEGAHFR